MDEVNYVETRQNVKTSPDGGNLAKLRGALIAASQGKKICFVSRTEYRRDEVFEEAMRLAAKAEDSLGYHEVRRNKIEFPDVGGRIFFNVLDPSSRMRNPFIGAIYDAIETLD